MYIASAKRKENIAEYLLYMWQIEDIIRANNLDIDKIKSNIIDKFDLNDDQRKELTEWYESLHHALLKDPKFDVYASEFYKTLPYIVELRSRQGESKLDEIETCFAALYGTLMLKLQGKGISVDTQKAIAQITKFISLLSKYHKLDQEEKDVATLTDEINRRRTFAIISHPDAGKTTLTEKLLLFGGAIHVAGAVKSNKIKKTATSDWMEIEKQRGISVATSVMGFNYGDYKINILDTPGHQDFAEDTYRTLTAVDSVIIVVDVAKGVEQQTRKLMEVCRMRNTPVIIFVNKLDREGRDPFEILDELEAELKISVRPLSWPINIGAKFKGVYNIYEHSLDLFTPSKTQVTERVEIDSVDDPRIDEAVGEKDAAKLREDLVILKAR